MMPPEKFLVACLSFKIDGKYRFKEEIVGL